MGIVTLNDSVGPRMLRSKVPLGEEHVGRPCSATWKLGPCSDRAYV